MLYSHAIPSWRNTLCNLLKMFMLRMINLWWPSDNLRDLEQVQSVRNSNYINMRLFGARMVKFAWILLWILDMLTAVVLLVPVLEPLACHTMVHLELSHICSPLYAHLPSEIACILVSYQWQSANKSIPKGYMYWQPLHILFTGFIIIPKNTYPWPNLETYLENDIHHFG